MNIPRPLLLQLADQPWCPPILRDAVQDLRGFLWTHRIWPIQAQPPCVLAADVIQRVIAEIENEAGDGDAREASGKDRGGDGCELDGEKGSGAVLEVVDMGSQTGAAAVCIERRINRIRETKNHPPIPFKVTDRLPHPTRTRLLSASPHLTASPAPVDPRDTGISLKSSRHIRTFCGSFHRLGETGARRAIEDAMKHSEGICIFEVQTFTLASIILTFCLFPLAFLILPFTRSSRNLRTLLLTYLIPVIPTLFLLDSLIACSRTRSVEHIVHLGNLAQMSVNVEAFDDALTDTRGAKVNPNGDAAGGEVKKHGRVAEVEWTWMSGRSRHTWGLGEMVWVVGRREAQTRSDDRE